MPETIDIGTVVLTSGKHSGPESGMCIMELASYIAREPWSDHPACVSPVLGAFLRSWNDALDEETRQMLKPYAAKVIGTAGDGKDEQRAWMAVDWLSRTQLPVWLDLAGLSEHAASVRATIPISSAESASAAQPVIAAAWAAAGNAGEAAAGTAARAAAWEAAGTAARAAAGNAAGNAAWEAARAAAWAAAGNAGEAAAWDAAAWEAAWEAAGTAARAAAWEAAGTAARAAAGNAAGNAAWEAARDAARAAAWDAAWKAAKDAAWDAAWEAAWAAAWDALRPSVVALQSSAFELLDRMINAS